MFIRPVDLLNDADEVLSPKENNLLVTFDDGLKEQFDFALPILDELNIQALFFVNSINFENKKVSTVHKTHLLRSIISSSELRMKLSEIDNFDFLEDEMQRARAIYIYDDEDNATLKYILNFKLNYKEQEFIIEDLFKKYFNELEVLETLYLSEQNLKYLAAKECLGSHTHSHYPLGLLNSDDIKFELANSKSYLENLTDSKIDILSYPYGTSEACTKQVADIAKDEGYKIGFTTTRGINTLAENHLLLNRFDCNDLIGGKNYK
ncbi:polysaccharide deacetylase family protein [Flavobacterium daemonense]|uniref:polysaccharide deacetylase family protein n=1 Tax=Flavobacterium daemonense TaxID=1393049 RepID=UPI0013A65F63|nr:polysaccharide deacetylase family protein [Flavobacterium daemonense]KAF2333112.1 polysaccharide deacetylase family protein [Flavobacterium daemonense]